MFVYILDRDPKFAPVLFIKKNILNFIPRVKYYQSIFVITRQVALYL